MKRSITILLILLLSFSLFADSKILTVLAAPPAKDIDGESNIEYATRMFNKDFPDVKVDYQFVNLGDGSTMTIDAMLAAGIPPNVYIDTLVRASKLIVPEYALPLDGKIRDLSKYNKDALDPFRRDGKLLALPQQGAPQGFCINLDIMDEIGYKVPDKWTVADFLKMAELVKQKYAGKKFATGMFAGNQSGDYLINNWFAAFGAKYYKPGDYSKTTIRETGGAKVYEFFQTLVKNGYVPPMSATLDDDVYAAEWAKGNYAATAFFAAWMEPYWKTAIEQGHIKAPFRVQYVPFPRGPGVKDVPTYSSYAAYVIHKTGTIADTWAARFVEYANDAYVQKWQATKKTFPNRSDVKVVYDDPAIMQILKIYQDGGLYDAGVTTAKFPATRPQHYPVLQKVLNLTISPSDAIAEYERRLNEALK